MRQCPYCEMEIQDAARECWHCRRWPETQSGKGQVHPDSGTAAAPSQSDLDRRAGSKPRSMVLAVGTAFVFGVGVGAAWAGRPATSPESARPSADRVNAQMSEPDAVATSDPDAPDELIDGGCDEDTGAGIFRTADGSFVFQASGFADYYGTITVCVTKATKACRKMEPRELADSMWEWSIGWNLNFPDEGPGRYAVVMTSSNGFDLVAEPFNFDVP